VVEIFYFFVSKSIFLLQIPDNETCRNNIRATSDHT
jgi:hypothetical protein